MSRRLAALLAPLALLGGAGVVTLAAPGTQECFAQASTQPGVEGRLTCPGGTPPAARCTVDTRLRSVTAGRAGRGVRFGFVRRGAGRVTVDVFRVSERRRIVGNRRVARFSNRAASFTWSGRGRSVGDGAYFVRYSASGTETRRLALRRRDGRFSSRPAFETRNGCGTVRAFKLERPAFGGRTNRALGISYRLTRAARVTVTVTRAGRTVRRFRTTSDRAGRTYRLRLASEGLRRGDHQVRLSVRPSSGSPVIRRLTSARL